MILGSALLLVLLSNASPVPKTPPLPKPAAVRTGLKSAQIGLALSIGGFGDGTLVGVEMKVRFPSASRLRFDLLAATYGWTTGILEHGIHSVDGMGGALSYAFSPHSEAGAFAMVVNGPGLLAGLHLGGHAGAFQVGWDPAIFLGAPGAGSHPAWVPIRFSVGFMF